MINQKEIDLYLEGRLDYDSTLNLFQELLDSGVIYTMPPLFKLECEQLLKKGIIFHADRR